MRKTKWWKRGYGLTFLFFMFITGCGRPDIDIKRMNIFGLPCSSNVSVKDIVDIMGYPEDRAIIDRFLWRPSRLFLRYYLKGIEIGFDSEGRQWDPRTSNFRQAYIFLQPEDKFRAFTGTISYGISSSWRFKDIENKLGPPDRIVNIWDEIEWHYNRKGEFEILFIADKKTEKLKGIMFLRKKRDRKM